MRPWIVVFGLAASCAHERAVQGDRPEWVEEPFVVVQRAFEIAIADPGFVREGWSDCRLHLDGYRVAVSEAESTWKVRFLLRPACERKLPATLDGRPDIDVEIEKKSLRLIQLRFSG